MTSVRRLRIFALATLLAGSAAGAAQADVMKELVPTGTLRVAIAYGPTPSALYALKDPTTGKFRGVTIMLGTALAKKLGVPVEFIPHLASGEIQAEASANKWDVTFMPVDETRKKIVDFGNAYHLLQSTFLVAPGSGIQKIEDTDTPSVRIGGVASTATYRAAQHAVPKATFVTVPGVAAAVEAMKTGKIDAIGLSRESLAGLATKIPGSRILDGGFLNSSTAIAVTKGKPEALAYVSEFIEEAKASGLVRKAFDEMGLKNSQVAPAGMKP
jgi:polar amino acid transport system substrate-binding protein